jgi:hypothetical protein
MFVSMQARLSELAMYLCKSTCRYVQRSTSMKFNKHNYCALATRLIVAPALRLPSAALSDPAFKPHCMKFPGAQHNGRRIATLSAPRASSQRRYPDNTHAPRMPWCAAQSKDKT